MKKVGLWLGTASDSTGTECRLALFCHFTCTAFLQEGTLNQPRVLSHSAHVLFSRPFTIWAALFWSSIRPAVLSLVHTYGMVGPFNGQGTPFALDSAYLLDFIQYMRKLSCILLNWSEQITEFSSISCAAHIAELPSFVLTCTEIRLPAYFSWMSSRQSGAVRI